MCTCGEVLEQRELHTDKDHESTECVDCGGRMMLWQLQLHECEIVLKACVYCELSVQQYKYEQHTKDCGNRTVRCHTCKGYVRTCDWEAHAKTDCLPTIHSSLKHSYSSRTATKQSSSRKKWVPVPLHHLNFKSATPREDHAFSSVAEDFGQDDQEEPFPRLFHRKQLRKKQRTIQIATPR